MTEPAPRETATLAGGCFWCLEAVFEKLYGVERVVSGYIGGRMPNPTYSAVCSGMTGHAEAVQVTFDPRVISYAVLLDLFFAFHDPTTLNRQGPDAGTQYRSAIFWHDETQRAEGEAAIARAQEAHPGRPVVTELARADTFWPAEDYHQGYFRKNPSNGYCQVTITPKLAKLRAEYGQRLRRDRSR